MTRYQKIWISCFSLIVIAIVFCLSYGSLTSDKLETVQNKINNLSIDQVDKIIIAPSNPDFKINLTLDTILISNKDDLISIINIIKMIKKKYQGKIGGGEWDAKMIIIYKTGERILLNLRDSEIGFFIHFTNVTGYQFYFCDRLKKYLETYTDYKSPVGGK